MSRTATPVLPILAIVLFAAYERPGSAREILPGVVVEDVANASAGEKAGLRPGDVLLAWQRPANPSANPEKAEGKIESVFDWMWVEMEHGPRGTVKVSGERDGRPLTIEVPRGLWGVKVRPRLDEKTLNIYLEGKAAIDARTLESGAALWSRAAKFANTGGSWMYLRIGDTWAEARRWADASAAYDMARAESEGDTDIAKAFVWDAIGVASERQSKFTDAENAYEAARAARERMSIKSLGVANSLNKIGGIAWHRGDLPTAESYFRRALALFEELAAGSLQVARALNNLGLVAWNRDELAEAEGYYKRAVAIQEQLAPEGPDIGASLNNLGNVAFSRGALDLAETQHRRVLAIQTRIAPDSLPVAASLNNLGAVMFHRGDLASAESLYRQALEIRERLVPNSQVVSTTLTNLGNVAFTRGDLISADVYHKRALQILEKLAPESLAVATSLSNLSVLARNADQLSLANQYAERALDIQQKLAPDSLSVAATLSNMGEVALNRGDLTTAAGYFTRVLELREKLAPGSLVVAESLKQSGTLAHRQGDVAAARTYFEGAIAVRAKLAPGSLAEAESRHDLGVLYRSASDVKAAADHFAHAIDALEAQVGKLGGPQEIQAGFAAQSTQYYRDYIDTLVEENQHARAFSTLERSRARTLLAMMAERDLIFTADIPADVEQERKRIAWDYDQTQEKLARLNPLKDQAQIDTSLNQLRELRNRQTHVVERIRQTSPRLASLQYPQPLDVKASRAALDAGTALLSYSIGKDKSYLFVLTPGAEVYVHPLPVGERHLRDEIERFRSLIQRAALGATDKAGILERGRHLYDLLVHPAAATIATARRVLIVADGPLHVLPFAALVRGLDTISSKEQRDWQYLIEWKPLHTVVSATVYAEIRKARPRRGAAAGPMLIAFGNPTYPTIGEAGDAALDKQDAEVRAMLTRGFRLTPLPATTTEVTAIARLYRGNAEAYLGDEATEERAKSVAASARYLHFASHGVLDERFPLNSGLALTIPREVKEGQDNGILQAWEVFERLRIDADLVVLSACETGLGKEMGGEGLVGLTRAFQYAGARSVLASLWSVADETTAVLMERFYGYLKAGKSKDAALRDAQLDLIRGAVALRDRTSRKAPVDRSHPFYWAAFRLTGDWR
jgi:CHAT domain-containing protein/Tfp pilus assembly protein PilF